MWLYKKKKEKKMDEIRESIRKTQQEIEDLENAKGSEREVEKLEGKLRTLELEHMKARNKYTKIFQSEKEEAPLEESIQVLENLENEDLAEEEVDANEALKAIRKQKDALSWRITLEMCKASDPSVNLERIKESEYKVVQLKETYSKVVGEEREFQKKLAIYQASLQQEAKTLEKERADLERANEEDRKIISNKNIPVHKRTAAEEREAQRNRENEWVDTRLEETGQDTRLEQDRPLLEKIRDLQKIWRDSNRNLSYRGSHNWGCRQFNNKGSESHQQSTGKRS